MNTLNMKAITKQTGELTIATGSIFFTGGFMNPKVLTNPTSAMKRELGNDLFSLTVGPGPLLLLSMYDDRGVVPRSLGMVDSEGNVKPD